MGARDPGITLPTVSTDYVALTRDAMQVLLDAGHQRIAMISHLPYRGGDRITVETRREVLFEEGLNDIADDETLLVTELEEEAAIKRAVERLLRQSSRPTAILALGDYQAIWTLEVAEKLGMRAPGDLAMITLCDSPLCVHHRPAISAIDQSDYRSGFIAGMLLSRIMAGEDLGAEQIVVSYTLKLRETTGAFIPEDVSDCVRK